MPTDGYDVALSVSRRTLDLEDYVDIMRRQKAWVIGPAFAGIVVAVVVAFLWPDTFVSTAVVRVVPPQVPESLVPTNVNMEMQSRINSMAQTILSRTNLTNIITSNNLYERERAKLPMEDVVEGMRLKDVKMSQVMNITGEGKRQIPAFQISFSYRKRTDAQKVCADLVRRFIDENARDRQNTSQSTTLFLKDQLEQKKRELEIVEDKLAKFRIEHSGKLPDQMQQNWQQINSLEQRLSNLNSNISRINQDKLLTEAQVRIYQDQLKNMGSGEVTIDTTQVKEQAKNERLASIETQILQQETRIAALKEIYKDTHPDMRSNLQALEVLKRQKDTLEKEEAKKPAPAQGKKLVVSDPRVIKDRSEMDAAIKRLQSSLEAKDMELEEAKRDAQRIDGQIKAAQTRLDVTPLGEKQYSELSRERDLVRQQVEDLNRKQSFSRISQELEQRQQSETLELLDPASLPMKPAQPDRALIVAAGTAIGLALGLFLSIGRELKDSSLKNLKDVRAYTQLQILGSIPLLENDLVVRRRRRLGMLAWSTAVILGCVIMSGAYYYYTNVLTKG